MAKYLFVKKQLCIFAIHNYALGFRIFLLNNEYADPRAFFIKNGDK